MNVDAIRDTLRNDSSKDAKERRKLIALSALGLVDFSIISLYQTGVIRHLPDIPLPIFDSNKVNAAKDAYQFGVPDGPVSAVVYGLTMVMASASGTDKANRSPLFDVALGATVAGNAGGALYYLYDMVFKQKKICLYCVTGAAINIASAVIVAPLVKKSLKKLFGK